MREVVSLVLSKILNIFYQSRELTIEHVSGWTRYPSAHESSTRRYLAVASFSLFGFYHGLIPHCEPLTPHLADQPGSIDIPGRWLARSTQSPIYKGATPSTEATVAVTPPDPTGTIAVVVPSKLEARSRNVLRIKSEGPYLQYTTLVIFNNTSRKVCLLKT